MERAKKKREQEREGQGCIRRRFSQLTRRSGVKKRTRTYIHRDAYVRRKSAILLKPVHAYTQAQARQADRDSRLSYNSSRAATLHGQEEKLGEGKRGMVGGEQKRGEREKTS